MPSADLVVASSIARSPRVLQLEGLFAIPPSAQSTLSWHVELPIETRPWSIGLIVGPSGSGKTRIARHFWPTPAEIAWRSTHSVVDDFPKALSVKEIVLLLSSVGFSDPPAWLRPFGVLSNGEQFRVTMARLLAEPRDGPLVVDEFTSVVDRTVAQVASAAVARVTRERQQQLIAVSCHEDVEPWLQPDWVYRPATAEFHWRELQRWPLSLVVERVHRTAWQLFRHHHYLDTSLNASALCAVAFFQQQPAAFIAALGFPHAVRPSWRLHRLVCLPDYQGVGIGVALADRMSAVLKATGKPVLRVAAHPAVVAHCARSSFWSTKRAPSLGAPQNKKSAIGASWKNSARMTACFEYVGPMASVADVRALLPEWGDEAQRVADRQSRAAARGTA